MEWVPVDKRLPTKEEQDDELGVLVTLGNGYNGLQFDYYYNGLWDDWNGYVVAWMPLPKPFTADTPQTEKPKIRKRIDKPFRAVWLDDDLNEIGTPQTDEEYINNLPWIEKDCPWK